ncbi:MAG: peptidylprolyl isomerase [Kofleriaceae bacterium]
MRLPALALAVATLSACPRSTPTPPTTPTELTRADRLEIAQLEVQRAAAVPALIKLADDRHPGKRALALRALGRIGTADAVAELRRRLIGEQAVGAAAALGLAGATGDLEEADAKAIVGELAMLPLDGPARAVVVEAMGRIGTAAAMPPLARALGAKDPATVAAAAIGLGRLGRAKVALDATAELTLVGLSRNDDAAVRYAATYALARGFVDPTAPPPGAPDPIVRALRDRLADSQGAIRAAAVAGLAARKAVPVTTPDLTKALDDGDWRVAVELVRALGGAAGTDQTRAAVVPYLALVAAGWSDGSRPPAFAHVLLEGLRLLTERAAEPTVRAVLVTIARSYTDRPPSAREPERRLAAAWANCLALGALARPLPTTPTGDMLNDPQVALAQLSGCGDGVLPEPLAQGVMLEAIAAGTNAPAQRLAQAANHGDPAIASAALALMPDVAKAATPDQLVVLRDALIAALGRDEPAVAGSAADAAKALLTARGVGGALAPLAAAVVARADRTVDDPELASGFLAVIAEARLDGLPVCQRLAPSPSPVLRAASRACVTALTGTDPGPRAAATPPARPPVDPDLALRTTGTWKLTTTQGELAISLDATIAPWHVATIIELTRRGFYDGQLVHRVVPDFVVQSGDPTGTGWGGPGFTLPAEPTSSLDPAAHFDGGAVGIADAGKDSGGSQWFAMHGPAPHLDGRYTYAGALVDGAEVLDRLQVGDRVIRARFE